MKVVLFCGGRGMRMREFSGSIPKPMVPVGPRPVMWHLMRYYAHFGHTDFVLALGYQGDVIKRYFLDYEEWRSNDFVLRNGKLELLATDLDDWTITFVDTGLDANIGERLLAVREHLDGEEMFCANYADGLSDAPLDVMIDRLTTSDAAGIFLCVPPSQSFHVVTLDERDRAVELRPAAEAGILVNGGYFVFRREIWNHLRPGEELVLEPFRRLMAQRRLLAHRHDGFWMGMDTFKDRQALDELHQAGNPPWAVWERSR
ncbi:MAG: glucose-1-phosphate cytidylyltransferase [Deltaproteobacteria bacterium]|nr:MAG: glucose-1-phosphate cytidylyltransferase [Deltaproteobacteria bacterium]